MGKRGGHNRKKGCIEQYIRYDAFSEIDVIVSGENVRTVEVGCMTQKRFSCPICKCNVRYLYETEPGALCCRKCANVNYPVQQWSKLEYAKYKMMQILNRLDVDTWNFDNWFEVLKFRPVKPGNISDSEFLLMDMELLKWQAAFSECITGKKVM
ncbi:MAG: hypothetical protein PUC12_04710 [Clostridiales bacterium]|nr:hypothetical protein [Clostridiales bacterium]